MTALLEAGMMFENTVEEVGLNLDGEDISVRENHQEYVQGTVKRWTRLNQRFILWKMGNS